MPSMSHQKAAVPQLQYLTAGKGEIDCGVEPRPTEGCWPMPIVGSSLEHKPRFIAKNGIAFGLVAGALWLVYMRVSGQVTSRSRIPMMLGLWLVAGIVWAWIMHGYLLRYRRGSREFYSQLREEMSATRVRRTVVEETRKATEEQEISITLYGYTYWENLTLAILTIYSSPLRAMSAGIFLLTFSVAIPFEIHSSALWRLDSGVRVGERLLEVGAVFVVVNFIFGTLVASAAKRSQRRIFRRLGPTTLTFSKDGVAIKPETGTQSELPWTSITLVREVAGFILLIRRARFIVGLPKRQLSSTDLERVRGLLSHVSQRGRA